MPEELNLIKQEDYKMLQQAIRGRWNIPLSLKTKAVQQLNNIVSDVETDTKNVLKAIQILGMLDRIDLEEIKMTMPKTLDIKSTSTEKLVEQLNKLIGPKNLDLVKQELLPSDS